jgi:hypothetical protein
MLFLVMVLVILAVVALWGFDLHKTLYIKTITRNASDGAALAAARWQGVTLNLLGELNVAQAVAINEALIRGDNNFSEAMAIADLQERVSLVGRAAGIAGAQQAAKNNGVYTYSPFGREMHKSAEEVRRSVAVVAGSHLNDYADMLDVVANDGLVALPSQYEYHILLDPNFYGAIETQNWCWFYNFHRYWLYNYNGWQDWPPLIRHTYLSLKITTIPVLNSLTNLLGDPSAALKALQQLSSFAGNSLDLRMLSDVDIPAVWYCYDRSWINQTWSEYLRERKTGPFPFISKIRPQYDVVGAEAVLRVSTDSPPTYFNAKSFHITTVVAAKPFGYLEGPVSPQTYGIVLPAFHDVRLIPVPSASMMPPPDMGGDSNSDGSAHMLDHVPIYLKYGPAGISELAVVCSGCRDLLLWEDPAFRQSGVAWLQTTNCPSVTRGPGPGGGASPPR